MTSLLCSPQVGLLFARLAANFPSLDEVSTDRAYDSGQNELSEFIRQTGHGPLRFRRSLIVIPVDFHRSASIDTRDADIVYSVYMRDGQTAEKIAAAARGILDQEGREAVTVRRVAGAVGITPMAVYRHYPDRQGLLNALADAGFSEFAARLTALPLSGEIEEALAQILDANLDFALENPRLFELMFLQPREGARQFPKDFKARKSPTANVMADLLRRGMEAGYFREDDPWELTFEMGALLQGLMMLFLGGRVGMSQSRFRSYCHRSFRRYLNGIRK